MPLPLNSNALNHRHVDSSISTNSELIDQVQSGALDASVCHLLTAGTQTAGRGQRTRSWQSPRGNVYLSLYHPVTQPISGLLSLIIGLKLAQMPIIEQLNHALQAANLTPIGVKWANDLGFYPPSRPHEQSGDDKIHYFKKLAGILIEPVWHTGKLVGVVMGVGLNVQATPELTAQTCEGMSYQALSLQDVRCLITQSSPNTTLTLPDLPALYVQISDALIKAMRSFMYIADEKPHQETPMIAAFLQEFGLMDALSGHYLRVTQNHQGESQHIYGVATGIDTNGCLQLRQDNGNICALFTGRIDVISRTQSAHISDK